MKYVAQQAKNGFFDRLAYYSFRLILLWFLLISRPVLSIDIDVQF